MRQVRQRQQRASRRRSTTASSASNSQRALFSAKTPLGSRPSFFAFATEPRFVLLALEILDERNQPTTIGLERRELRQIGGRIETARAQARFDIRQAMAQAAIVCRMSKRACARAVSIRPPIWRSSRRSRPIVVG